MLKEDIFFAKIHTDSGLQVKIRNTTTEKDFRLSDDTVALLDLCTGGRTIDEIVHTLSVNCGEPFEEVARDVYTIMGILQDKDILFVNATPLHSIKPVKVLSRYAPEAAQIEVT